MRGETYLGAGVVESAQRVERSPLRVEQNDVLHDGRIRAPVQRLQIVGGHDVDVALPRYAGEEHNLFGVP